MLVCDSLFQNGGTCLHYAVNRGNLKMVKLLISSNCDMNVINAVRDVLSTVFNDSDMCC